MAAYNKVVRLEEVASGTVHFKEDDNLLDDPSGSYITSISKSSKPTITSTDGDLNTVYDSHTDTRKGGYGSHSEDSLSELHDAVYPLPEGWPKLPQLFVRQSWDLSTAMSPTVNKATSHLELLQTIIEEWCVNTEADIRSRLSSAAALGIKSIPSTSMSHYTLQAPGTASSGKRQLHFKYVDEMTEYDDMYPVAEMPPSRLSKASHVSHPTTVLLKRSTLGSPLSVRGIGALKTDDGTSILTLPHRYTPQTPDYEIPYLGAEEVIQEVILLLAHLEDNRRETKHALVTESNRVCNLQNRIDTMCEKRLTELPDAVQKEHEACALDINELNWHVNYRGRVESRTQNKVDIAQALNLRLKQDISFVGKHVPLVQEKLELEKDAMDRIRQAQLDTNEELNTTVERCAKVEAKSEEAHNKAAIEREHIKNDIKNAKQELQQIIDDLNQARATQNTYISMGSEYQTQLVDNKQELLVLHIKQENCKAAEKMTAVKVKDLQGKIVEEEFEQGRLEDENTKLRSTRDTKRKDHAEEEVEFRSSIDTFERELRELSLKNKELDMEIEDDEDKITDCKEQKIKDEKNIIRMEKEMERTDEQYKMTLDDYSKVIVINSAIRSKLEKEETKCVHEEEALKTTAETLRKQVKEEIHSRTVIKARMSSDDTELIKTQTETTVKKSKISRKAVEVEQAVKQILSKVEKLRSAYADRTKTKSDLMKKLENLKDQIRDMKNEFKEKKETLTPYHTKMKTEMTNLEKRLDHMEWDSERMNKEIEDMSASRHMMARAVIKTDIEIKRLKEEHDELTIQIEASQFLQDNLKASISHFTSRYKDIQHRHRDHMEARDIVYNQLKRDFKRGLEENKRLASHYRSLQNKYIRVKNTLLNLFDESVTMEIAIKDLKQLQNLQQHMHTCLKDYYKFRGLYNQSELSRMDTESFGNSAKVQEIQTRMDESLENITGYLREQMDPMHARRIAMKKVADDEAKELLAAGGKPVMVDRQSSLLAVPTTTTGRQQTITAH